MADNGCAPKPLRSFVLPRLYRFLLMLALSLCGSRVDALPNELAEPNVQVRSQEGTLVLDISYQVPVRPQQAWAVLMDFENMPAFIPNLEISRVLQHNGEYLEVEQKGSISLGPLTIPFESRREVAATPYQFIRSHSLSGSTRLESTLALIPLESGTQLAYHASAVPELPVPSSLIASYMSELLRDQFKAMGREMMRREQAADPQTQIAR
jgi:carbon monoxide dehydrogenase subunit G